MNTAPAARFMVNWTSEAKIATVRTWRAVDTPIASIKTSWDPRSSGIQSHDGGNHALLALRDQVRPTIEPRLAPRTASTSSTDRCAYCDPSIQSTGPGAIATRAAGTETRTAKPAHICTNRTRNRLGSGHLA